MQRRPVKPVMAVPTVAIPITTVPTPAAYHPTASGPCYDPAQSLHTPAARNIDYNALPSRLSSAQQKRVYMEGYRRGAVEVDNDGVGLDALNVEVDRQIMRKYHLTKKQLNEIHYEGWFYGWGYIC